MADTSNSLNAFSYIPSGGKSGIIHLKDVEHMSNLNLKDHRMIPEFEALERIIQEHDTTLANQMNKVSLLLWKFKPKLVNQPEFIFPKIVNQVS